MVMGFWVLELLRFVTEEGIIKEEGRKKEISNEEEGEREIERCMCVLVRLIPLQGRRGI